MTETNDSPILVGDELEEAIENADWSDPKYDDIPRYKNLSDEKKAENHSFGADFALAAALSNGDVPQVGTVITKSYPGDNEAEALGRAYVTRDQIREAGGSCEVEYIEPHLIIGHSLYHTVEITVTESAGT